MNEHIEIKKMLDRYYEGESTDDDELRLCEYFGSADVTAELQPYRSIFAYIRHEIEEPTGIILPVIKPRRVKLWYAAAAVAACLIAGVFLIRHHLPANQTLCTGTFVMINGVCYDDISLVKKYAAETIDMVLKPLGDGAASKALDFLNEEF